MTNVTPLRVAENPYKDDIVERLELLLEIAKKGEINHLMCIVNLSDNTFASYNSGSISDTQLIGMMECLKHDMITQKRVESE